MSKMIVKEAPVIWDNLKSIICVHKPANTSVIRARNTIINAICTGLNEMECRPPIDYVSIEGNPSTRLSVKVGPNLADHTLVVGPRYQHKDVVCSWSNYLGFNTSGVLLFGIRRGTKQAKTIRETRSTRSYHISGRLGQATEGGFQGEKIVEKSTWKYITLGHIEQLVASMQASHQREMFKSCGLDLQSQSAYEMAVQGPIRPANSKMPVIYGMKCIHFDPPDFTLEIQCINEYETYLKGLIHEIGLRLHSTAHCTRIQCIRHSYFTLENALLRKHWTLQHILTNMEECSIIMDKHENILKQESANLQ